MYKQVQAKLLEITYCFIVVYRGGVRSSGFPLCKRIIKVKGKGNTWVKGIHLAKQQL